MRTAIRRGLALLALAAMAACGGGDGPGGDGPAGPGGGTGAGGNGGGGNNGGGAAPTPLRTLAGSRIGVGAAGDRLFRAQTPQGAQLRTVLAREFDVLVAENQMKFGPLRPTRTTFSYGPADELVAFAQANNMRVRGHTLVWHQQNAAWLTGGTWTRDSLSAILEEHVRGVVGHFRGRVVAWDVVNEAYGDGPAPALRNSVWYQHLGRGYIEQAFRAARAADPAAALFYNDYSLEWPGAKQDSVFNLLKELRARGVPVDGIGFQAHFGNGSLTPSKEQLVATFTRFAGLGLKIHVTELDVRVPLPSGPASLEEQATHYRKVFEACLAVSACEMVVTWGVSDADSWIPGTFPGQGDALLYDAGLQPKAAYRSVNALLAGS